MRTIGIDRLKHLAIFATVYELGSFAACARALNTSRSRISEQINQLEEDLNLRLLHRSTRHLSLTSEGTAIYEYARQLNVTLNHIQEIAGQEKPQGRVSITTTNDIAISQLLPALKSFKTAYPDIDVDVISSDEKLDLISEGIDLALRVSYPKDNRLTGKILHEESFGIFASTRYLEEHAPPQSIEELARHQWIILKLPELSNLQTLFQNDKTYMVRPKLYHACNSPLMMQKMIMADMGIGILLPSTMKEEIETGKIVRIMEDYRGNHLVYALVYPSKHHLPLRTRCLIDHLVKGNLFGLTVSQASPCRPDQTS